MSRRLTSTAEDSSSDYGSETLLQGTELVLARVGWVIFTLLSVGFYIASLPSYFAYLHIVNSTFSGGPQLSPSDLRLLHTHGLTLSEYVWFHIGLNLITLLVSLLVAVVLFWRKSNERLALLASISLVVFPLIESIPLVGPLVWPLPTDLVGFVGIVGMGFFFYIFPDGRFVPRWARWLMIGWIAFWAIAVFFPAIPPHSNLFALWLLCLVVSQIILQIYRFRRVSSPLQRQQTKWVSVGVAVACGSWGIEFFLLYGLLPGFFHMHLSPLGHVLSLLPANLLLLVFPLSIGIAILRYKLWDIDFIINRALVYGMLTACVIGLYVLVVVGLGWLIQAQGNLLLSLLATGIIAVLFQPLRERLQEAINRLMYGERDAPYTVISRLGDRLVATVAPETVLPSIVETVAQALKLPYAAITLKYADEFSLAASYGVASGELVHLPLVYQTEQVGELLLAPRTPGESFTPPDHRLLHDLAQHAGEAAHTAQLTRELKRLAQDLQYARERLVSAREEERRRLRRDLHDGLGPQLSSQTMLLTRPCLTNPQP